MIFVPIRTEPCATTATGKVAQIAEPYVPILDYKISSAVVPGVVHHAYVVAKMLVAAQSQAEKSRLLLIIALAALT